MTPLMRKVKLNKNNKRNWAKYQSPPSFRPYQHQLLLRYRFDPFSKRAVPPIRITERIIVYSQRKMKFRRLKEEQMNKCKPQMSANERKNEAKDKWNGWAESSPRTKRVRIDDETSSEQHEPSSSNLICCSLYLMTTTLRWTMMSRRIGNFDD